MIRLPLPAAANSRLKADDRACDGGFARSTFADEGKSLALADFKGEAAHSVNERVCRARGERLQCPHGAEADAQILDTQQRTHAATIPARSSRWHRAT